MFYDKVIIITGSTQGIGFTTAELLLRRGASVVINSRSQQKVDLAIQRLSDISPNILGIAGDVRKEAFCKELRDRTIDRFGRIDILINNAGVASGGLIKDMLPDTFASVIQTNLLGSVNPTIACLNDIRKNKGAVLFIGSVAGIVGLPNYAPYSASKKALVSLAESLRNELSGEGVFVGINYPGFTENETDKTIMNAKGELVPLLKRQSVHINSRYKTAGRIVEQLEKRKFRMYSDIFAVMIQVMYRLFPGLTLLSIKLNRKKILNMQ